MKAPSTARRPIAFRVLGFSLLIPVVLFVAYLAVANAILNLGIGRRLLNCRPEVVHVSFVKAWTLWPLRVHVTGARVSGQDSHTQFDVTADWATMRFSPRGLLDKTVTGSGIRGRGMTVRVRSRMTGMLSPKELAQRPEISNYPSPLRDPGPDILPKVGVRLEDVDVQDLREVWVDNYRFVGSVDVQGGFYYKPYRALRVDPTELTVHSGTLSEGDTDDLRVLTGMQGTLKAAVDELNPAKADVQALRKVSAAVDLHAGLANIRFLNRYIARAEMVRLDGGAGDLVAQVRIEYGTLAAGSLLEVTSNKIVVSLPYFDANGSGSVRLQVDPAHPWTDLNVNLGSSVVLVQRKDNKTCMRSGELRLSGHTNTLDLTRAAELDLHLEIPAAAAPDLTFLNNYIPNGTGVRIDGGAGKLGAQFNLDTAKKRIDGRLDVEGSRISLQNHGTHLRGGVHVHGVLNRLDLDTLHTDITGSYILLHDVTITTFGAETPDWGMRVDFGRTTIHPKGKTLLDTLVELRIKNLQPIMRIVAANVKIPRIATALSNRKDAVINAHMTVGETTMDITGVKITTGNITVEGQVHLSDIQKKQVRDSGVMLLKWRALAVGLDIKDKVVRAILIRPSAWYAKETVARAN